MSHDLKAHIRKHTERPANLATDKAISDKDAEIIWEIAYLCVGDKILRSISIPTERAVHTEIKDV
jgi:hypothetical protein